MKLKQQMARAWDVARGDVYEEDRIGNVVCPRCARCAQEAKFLHRLWHRVFLEHQIVCSECGTVRNTRTRLGLIAGFKRWREVTKQSRALEIRYRSYYPNGADQQ